MTLFFISTACVVKPVGLTDSFLTFAPAYSVSASSLADVWGEVNKMVGAVVNSDDVVTRPKFLTLIQHLEKY